MEGKTVYDPTEDRWARKAGKAAEQIPTVPVVLVGLTTMEKKPEEKAKPGKAGKPEKTEKLEKAKKAEKKPKLKRDDSVRHVIMSHSSALVSMPLGVKRKAGLAKGVDVKVVWDEESGTITIKAINPKYAKEKPEEGEAEAGAEEA